MFVAFYQRLSTTWLVIMEALSLWRRWTTDWFWLVTDWRAWSTVLLPIIFRIIATFFSSARFVSCEWKLYSNSRRSCGITSFLFSGRLPCVW